MSKDEVIKKLNEFIKTHGEYSTLADLPDDPSHQDTSLKDGVYAFVLPRYPILNPENCKQEESKILLKDIIADLEGKNDKVKILIEKINNKRK